MAALEPRTVWTGHEHALVGEPASCAPASRPQPTRPDEGLASTGAAARGAVYSARCDARRGGTGICGARTRGFRLALVAVLATAAASLAPNVPTAGASMPDNFFGVVTQGGNTRLQAADFERMGAGGVGTLRFLLYWPYIQPQKGPCTASSRYDPGFGVASSTTTSATGPRSTTRRRSRGPWGAAAAVPLRLAAVDRLQRRGQPARRWVAPVNSLSDRGAWARFVQAAVRRYGRGGVFWSEHPSLMSAAPIELWQVWNEPGSPSYLQPRPSVSTYAQLLEVSASAIRTVDPSASILLAGLFNNPRAHLGGIPMRAFLSRLYAIPGAASNFDVVALHPYAANIGDVRSQIVSARQIMNAHGDRTTPIWITESSGGRRRVRRGTSG